MILQGFRSAHTHTIQLRHQAAVLATLTPHCLLLLTAYVWLPAAWHTPCKHAFGPQAVSMVNKVEAETERDKHPLQSYMHVHPPPPPPRPPPPPHDTKRHPQCTPHPPHIHAAGTQTAVCIPLQTMLKHTGKGVSHKYHPSYCAFHRHSGRGGEGGGGGGGGGRGGGGEGRGTSACSFRARVGP